MAFGKADLTHVVLPVPRGPNKKKLLALGGVINLEYITPFYIYIWSCQVNFYRSIFTDLKCTQGDAYGQGVWQGCFVNFFLVLVIKIGLANWARPIFILWLG